MDMHEFNEAFDKVVDSYRHAQAQSTPDAIAQVHIVAAMNGLIIADMSLFAENEIPQPICRFLAMPSEGSAGLTPNSYVYPADQH